MLRGPVAVTICILAVACTTSLVGCKRSVDAEAFQWVNELLPPPEYWCCHNEMCYPGRSGEPLRLRDSNVPNMFMVVTQSEWEASPEESRAVIPAECRYFAGYGNQAWAGPQMYEAGSAEGVFVYARSVDDHPSRRRPSAWMLTWTNPIRQEKNVFAYEERGDCLEEVHSMRKAPAKGESRYADVSECIEVAIQGGKLALATQGPER